MKKSFLLLFFPIFLTFAHKISAFIDYEAGKATVYTYFSDGTPAKNALVKVIDEKNNKVVLTGRTDQNGVFTFKVPYDGKFKVEVDAELGHRAVAELVAGNTNSEHLQAGQKEQSTLNRTNKQSCTLNEDEIRKLLREELKPIHQKLLEIQEQQLKVSFTEILGGIGWIFGIFGLWCFLNRKK
jgi:nickel transport protein